MSKMMIRVNQEERKKKVIHVCMLYVEKNHLHPRNEMTGVLTIFSCVR